MYVGPTPVWLTWPGPTTVTLPTLFPARISLSGNASASVSQLPNPFCSERMSVPSRTNGLASSAASSGLEALHLKEKQIAGIVISGLVVAGIL